MGRYANAILIIIGLTAAVILGIDSFSSVEILPGDAVALMCVIAAVPPVIAAIRHHTNTTRAALMATNKETKAAIAASQAATTTALAAFTRRIEGAIEQHGDRTCKHTTEKVLSALAKGQLKAQLDRADFAEFTDTGPFRIPG